MKWIFKNYNLYFIITFTLAKMESLESRHPFWFWFYSSFSVEVAVLMNSWLNKTRPRDKFLKALIKRNNLEGSKMRFCLDWIPWTTSDSSVWRVRCKETLRIPSSHYWSHRVIRMGSKTEWDRVLSTWGIHSNWTLSSLLSIHPYSYILCGIS